MKGDFSRFTFDRTKHYSGVRMQQGRVQLDVDWNEQLDLTTHLRETAVRDVIGEHGAPENSAGFEITVDAAGNLMIGAGRYYVDGILVENEADVAVQEQPDLPPKLPPQPINDGWYVAYLDVFKHQLTALEDPDLLEPALGGPDTATRVKNLWQLRLREVTGTPTDCSGFVPPRGSGPTPLLCARGVGQPAENQLYRIEVHEGGTLGTATYKWSRQNGSVAARIDNPATNQIRITTQISQDLAGGFAAEDWIEVTDQGHILRGEPGIFARLSKVEGQVLEVVAWPGGAAPDLPRQPIVRRWEADEQVIAVPATNDGYIALEDGVEIQFRADPTADFYTGDFWVVAGRAAAGVLWPLDAAGDPVFQEPHGVRHHYAPVALVQRTANSWAAAIDCRQLFIPTTIIPGPEKVSVTGDTMTGKLTIYHDLEVTGTATIGTRLTMDTAPIVPAAGTGSDRGIAFPGDDAFLRFDAGGPRKLTLGVGNSESLALTQGGVQRLTVLADGKVGIGTDSPTVDLDVEVGEILLKPANALKIEGSLFIKGSPAPKKDQVLTAVDSDGQAVWKDHPERQLGVPVFLTKRLVVLFGDRETGGWKTYTLDTTKVPADASAVILEAWGGKDGPNSDSIDATLEIRRAPDEEPLLLIAGRAAGSGDDSSWGGQGIFPIKDGRFQYAISGAQGFNRDCYLYVVGYFP